MMFGRTNSLTRRGPAVAGFEAGDVLPALTRQAVDYLDRRAPDAKSGKPFFLYVPLNSPHTPIAPTKEWQGRSGLNPYADFVMQTDASVGTMLDALDRLGLARDTLVIFTSDNGCSPEAKFNELLPKGHNPSASFRGTKADIFDGGHHVPFLARWPGRVKPGATSDQLICLNDLFATCAEILGRTLPDTAAEDSVSFLPALEGRATQPLREALAHHSINGSFAIRQGPWKLELCADSGGWSAPRPGSPASKSLPSAQLYDMSRDISETNNLQAAHPEIVARLTRLLEKYAADGRSTPGAPQSNTTPVEIHRPARAASTARSPNILFVIADQWRAQAFGFAGDPNVRTPNFDRFERQTVHFCFADLLRALDETGLATSTIVVFTSDHGDMLRSQDQQRKQRPWEESARVPMLFRLPASLGIPPRRLAATINTEDIMPTLLGLCGKPIPKSVEGLDFSGALRGGADPSGGATLVRCISPFGEFTRSHGGREYRAVRTSQHTYVRALDGPWLLYDNTADPSHRLLRAGGAPGHRPRREKRRAGNTPALGAVAPGNAPSTRLPLVSLGQMAPRRSAHEKWIRPLLQSQRSRSPLRAPPAHGG